MPTTWSVVCTAVGRRMRGIASIAKAVAPVWAIAWIQNRYMETPFLRSALQIVLGGITAHYAVEGQSFYGIDLASILPYSVTRSWHLQLAVLWIATAWLATGLYIAPAISGHEPKFQRLGVNFLFTCLLVIVVGALGGQWFAVMQKMGLAANFWFGHQGWEYVDIGRFWQAFLFVGLMLWLVLVGRALWRRVTG